MDFIYDWQFHRQDRLQNDEKMMLLVDDYIFIEYYFDFAV